MKKPSIDEAIRLHRELWDWLSKTQTRENTSGLSRIIIPLTNHYIIVTVSLVWCRIVLHVYLNGLVWIVSML
ncbi:MAG: hypothetical protein PHI24_09185 [Desulfitobacteriaceae bacterium]|nr:hypothetical protein [Desulfitobacteriaceae bacterium]